ncbi:MAG TPA: ATPase domain-containing protein [Candidatus Nanoarchaeia archaeon]|nr:ATPase domain-containing protein [Candidatus Nanoarchaeia archaeon]
MAEETFEIERVSSGIKGLDTLISGGFVKGNSILICGAPGTGKTLLGLQFLYQGAKEFGENGLFVSIEDDPKKLKVYSKTFGWDLEEQVKGKKLDFLQVPIDHHGFNIIDAISSRVRKMGAKRIVIDSLSALNFNARMFKLPLVNQPDPTGTIARGKVMKVAGFAPFEDVTQFTYLLINRIADLGATTLFITDSPNDSTGALTKDGVSEFVCDGVLHVRLHDTSENVNRTLTVKKMRGGPIVPGAKSLKFTRTGLEIGDFKVFY